MKRKPNTHQNPKSKSKTRNEVKDLLEHFERLRQREMRPSWVAVGVAILAVIATSYFNYAQLTEYKRTTHDDLRAYLVVTQVKPDSIIVGNEISFLVKLKNVGKAG